MSPISQTRSVAIIGGGLAGLAAGCALADTGFKVTVYEKRPYVGGRASSYDHPGTGEVLDNCQHLLLGCCTNLIDFYERLGVGDKVRWFDEITFMEPGGRISRFMPKKFLPAPAHNVPSFIGVPMLDMKDKIAIARAMSAMCRKLPADSDENFLAWLRRHHQTERAIKRFWEPVLVSALNEDLELISVRYAAKVFRDSFMKSAQAGKMGLPTIPLSQLYAAAIGYIQSRGGEVLLRNSVSGFVSQADGVAITNTDAQRTFDFAVLAAPFQSLGNLLPPDDFSKALKSNLNRFGSSPITGIHLWFDREITDLPHAALLDRTIQWMFHKSKFQEKREGPGSYVELVVSASKSLVQKSREEILELAVRELAEFFPIVREAKVLKAAVIKEIYATYSISPGLDRFRPGAISQWPRVFLAGDWTATGWPATMEGAVRSGYLAAEAVTASVEQAKKFLVPDLPASGMMRLFEE